MRGDNLQILKRDVASTRQATEKHLLELKSLEKKLIKVRDGNQLANIGLESMLQSQQRLIQTMSNVSKTLHDTAMAVIRKLG